MNRFKKLAAFFAFALMLLTLPAVASAQWRDNRRNDDDYYRNGSYNNRALKATIKNLKNHSKQFEKTLDRALDRSRYDNRRREDALNELAERFFDATKDLDDNYDNRRDYRNSQDEVRQVLNLGSQLDRALSRTRLDYNVQREWSRIRQDLSHLAEAFRYDDRNRRDGDYRRSRRDRDDDYRRDRRDDDYGRDRRNDDWRSRIPFPFPF